jgi:nucleotide-binding universal stress UspA family protein
MSAVQDQPVSRVSTPTGTISRVIVGVDDTGPGLAAVAAAIRLARSHDAKLVAVRAWALGLPRHGGRRMRRLTHPHVVLSFSGSEQSAVSRMLVRRVFDAVTDGSPVPVAIQTPECDPALALVGIASHPGDILVVGAHSGYLAKRLVHGSVTRYCMRHAVCPVVVVSHAAGLPTDRAAAGSVAAA